MPLDLKTRKPYYNACDPRVSLPPDDPRNVDVDLSGPLSPRGERWVERLARPLELSDTPKRSLFTGLPGTGKSTELRRLCARLTDPGGMHAFAALVEADDLLDLNAEIDVPDVLLAALIGAERLVLAEEHRPLSDALAEGGRFARVWRWLAGTDIVEPAVTAEIAVGDPAGLVSAKLGGEFKLKTQPSLRAWVRERATLQLSEFLGQVRAAFEDLDQRVRVLGWEGGLVVILDSLEKLQGLTSTWETVMKSAERLFQGDLLDLPVHVVYTVPPGLTFRLHRHVEFMPMLKLRDAAGVIHEPGYAAAREMLRRRAPDTVLHALFDAEPEARLRQLIAASGGYPRELIRLAQELFTQSSWTQSELDRMIARSGEGYARTVPDTAYALLADVARTGALSTNDANLPLVERLFGNNVLLRYCNGNEWYGLHPAVAEIPAVKARIAKA